uniref:Uncharacterized protein n=1 Tax=Oryza meridionalis TaxID=40149 RepID=A0A0E0D460_9ORYZ
MADLWRGYERLDWKAAEKLGIRSRWRSARSAVCRVRGSPLRYASTSADATVWSAATSPAISSTRRMRSTAHTARRCSASHVHPNPAGGDGGAGMAVRWLDCRDSFSSAIAE